MNRLKKITEHGQSIWLDYTDRRFVATGELRKLITADGVTGVTSNPSIFAEAITHGAEYDGAIHEAAAKGLNADDAYKEIVSADIQRVADDLMEVFHRTSWCDGYVSLEVSPHLAHDTEGTIAEARELWHRVKRANLFIKVPATAAGLPAIQRLIADGINVNITLLFGLPRYRAVAEAYIAGLEERATRNEPIDRVVSVASFFLSRIDIVVDRQLDEIAGRDPALAARANALRGKAAIACAKQAYQMYKEIFTSSRFCQLAPAAPNTQRLLWASTSTKNPAERDVRYVEALIGPHTINTLPRQTLDAFRDHGDPTPRLEEGVDEARGVLRELGEIGIDLEQISHRLEEEGVQKFVQPFERIRTSLEQRLAAPTAALP